MVDRPTKIRRFREKNERELWILTTMGAYITQCVNNGEPEGPGVEMDNFAERVIKLIETEARRKKPTPVEAAENVTVMVSKKA